MTANTGPSNFCNKTRDLSEPNKICGTILAAFRLEGNTVWVCPKCDLEASPNQKLTTIGGDDLYYFKEDNN